MSFKQLPLVSVIIPVFNNANTLDDALSSVFAQDYDNLEVIVINDGSSDNSKDVLSKFSDTIRLIEQTNSGSAVARTRGIKEAKGKYIAFIDADDMWTQWKISSQVKYLEKHKDIGMVFNAWLEIHGENDRLPIFSSESDLSAVDETVSGWIYTKLLLECIVHTSSVLMLKRLCDEIGDFDANLKCGQDYDYWIRASQITKITKLRSILSGYRIHPDSITNKMSEKNYEAAVLSKAISNYGLCDAAGNSISNGIMRNRLANCWKDFCWKAYHSKTYSLSLQASIKMIHYRPFWYLGWAYLLATILRMMRHQIDSNKLDEG